MSKRSWVGLSLATLAVVAVASWWLGARPLQVEAVRVERGPFTKLVEEDGVTRVRDRFVVAAPVTGLLLRPSVRVGDVIQRGDVVASIVPNPAQMLDARTRSELSARVESAAAHASRARSLVRQTEAAAIQAENDHQRLEQLGSQGYASQTERERAALTLELRRKDAEAARFEADAAEHDLSQARAALRDGDATGERGRTAWTLRAPIDGAVLELRQESEAPVAMGTPILVIGDLSRLEARIDVLSTEAIGIEEQAYVDLDAGGVKLAGRVRRIEPSAYTKVSALGIEEQRVDVLVDILPNPHALRRVADGYRVDAAIEIAREEDVLLIPLSALFRSGESWATYQIVSGRARLTLLKVGSRGTDVATVLAGIEAGAAVIAYPSDTVEDGTRVIAELPPQGAQNSL